MSKAKFKIGDKVKVVKVTGSYGKTRYIGDTFTIREDYGGGGFRYYLDNSDGISNGWCYADEELELVVDDNIYTGIELLQAIKDGAVKDGDKFKVYLNGTDVDEAEILGSGYRLQIKSGWLPKGSLSLDDILNCEFVLIKKEPINTAKADKVLDVKIPVDILGKREFIDAKVTIKGNKIVVKLPSGVKGVSSCCPEDKFDEDKGIKIASARAIKKQIIRDLDKGIEALVK